MANKKPKYEVHAMYYSRAEGRAAINWREGFDEEIEVHYYPDTAKWRNATYNVFMKPPIDLPEFQSSMMAEALGIQSTSNQTESTVHDHPVTTASPQPGAAVEPAAPTDDGGDARKEPEMANENEGLSADTQAIISALKNEDGGLPAATNMARSARDNSFASVVLGALTFMLLMFATYVAYDMWSGRQNLDDINAAFAKGGSVASQFTKQDAHFAAQAGFRDEVIAELKWLRENVATKSDIADLAKLMKQYHRKGYMGSNRRYSGNSCAVYARSKGISPRAMKPGKKYGCVWVRGYAPKAASRTYRKKHHHHAHRHSGRRHVQGSSRRKVNRTRGTRAQRQGDLCYGKGTGKPGKLNANLRCAVPGNGRNVRGGGEHTVSTPTAPTGGPVDPGTPTNEPTDPTGGPVDPGTPANDPDPAGPTGPAASGGPAAPGTGH